MKTEVLKLLADGQFHSGQELADVLGVSRTAVWKQLGKTDELGLAVESVKGRGYRLPGGLQLLDERSIRQHLRPEAGELLGELLLPGIVVSTNTIVMEHIAQNEARGFVCSAEQQTAGRGRRGRQWVSPYGGNIYMSVAWVFDGGAAALEGLSLAVGVAVVEALESLGLQGLSLKWPNDVLVNGRKLAGILLEMVGDVSGRCQVVVGLGINVQMPEAAGADIDQPWIDIRSLPGGADIERNRLQAALLNALLPVLAEFQAEGFSAFRQRWIKCDAFAGQSVVMMAGDNKVAGRAAGVDERGALLLETAAGVKAFHGGEVSLRAAL